MRKSLLILCWLVTAPATLFAFLIIVPAPSYHLWMAAVAASEWSVWLLLSGLLSFLCGASALFIDRRSTTAWLGLTLSLLIMACASLPLIEAYRVAARQGVSLSWGRYLFGIRRSTTPVVIDEQHDIEFARPDGQALRLDVYQPSSASKRRPQANTTSPTLLPVIVVIHGGSWRSGTKSDFAQYDRWLAESGRVVFDADY